jgi:toxin ParE1/3/4
MAAELLWRPQARDDLLDIFEIVGFDDPAAAERILAALQARAATLADHPRLGTRRADIRPAARVLIERRYLILYETHPDTDEGPIDGVEIIRVVDGRRDLTNLF